MANLVDEVITLIDNSSVGMVGAIYGALGADALPFVRNMLIITTILFGISMMMGWVEYPIRQFAKNAFKIITVLALAFNWVFFDVLIYNLFTNSPDEIGTIILDAVGAGPAANISSQVGSLLEDGIIASGAAFASDGFFMPYVLGALIFIAILIICGFVLALLVLSKVAMTCVLALGPIFIIFLLFDGTRQMFASWIQQILNFGFIAILTYIVMAFFVQMLQTSINAIPLGEPELQHIAPLCLVGFVATFVLSQIPGIASGLAGGVQVSTMGAFAAMSRQLQRMRPRGGWGRDMPQRLRNINITRKNTIRSK